MRLSEQRRNVCFNINSTHVSCDGRGIKASVHRVPLRGGLLSRVRPGYVERAKALSAVLHCGFWGNFISCLGVLEIRKLLWGDIKLLAPKDW